MDRMISALVLLSCLILAGCTSPSAKIRLGSECIPLNLSGTYSYDAKNFHGGRYEVNYLFQRFPLQDHSEVIVSQTNLGLPSFQYVTAVDDVTRTNDLSNQAPYWTWQGGALIYGRVYWKLPWIPIGILRAERNGRMTLDNAGNLVNKTHYRMNYRLLFIIPFGSKESDCEFVLQRVK